MSDLISRKALINKLQEYKKDTISVREKLILYNVINDINKQPTAFDVNEVVEQLLALKNPYKSFPVGTGALNEYDYYINSAINIVKGAVKSE